MKTHLFTCLLEAGLTESEAMIYVELLKAPAQTKWEVVERTGLARNKVYRSFEKLKHLDMIDLNYSDGIRVKSLKRLVSDLKKSSRKSGRLSNKIKNLSPYLGMEEEIVKGIEIIDDSERLNEVYLMMSEIPYDTVLDFGDFERFVPMLDGDMHSVFKFRELRAKHADCNTICTTDGPMTRCVARKSALKEFNTKMDICDLDFKDKWIIFSDTNDHVLFNDMPDKENQHSVLVHSKIIADTQRSHFKHFSQMLEKC